MGNMMTEKKREFASAAGVKARGWTDAMIGKFLGEPDKLVRNPRYRSASEMRLYAIDRVEAAEVTEDFKAFQEKSKNRRASALKVAERKRDVTLERAKGYTPKVDVIPMETLRELALDAYEDRQCERAWRRGDHYFSITDIIGVSREFSDRISVNYLRHERTTYDERLMDDFGQVGRREAYPIIKRNVLKEIARLYPELADECQRQIQRSSAPM